MSPLNSPRAHPAPPTEMERFSFWDGQMLRANDLNRLGTVADARRWWHNRALHNAYGIACGLEVVSVRADRKKRSKVTGLRLLSGIAYDAFGRMLYVPLDRDLPFPSGVPDAVEACLLVIRFRSTASSAGICSPVPRCCGGERTGAGEGIELTWVEESRVAWSQSVPLARVTFTAAHREPRLDAAFVAPRLRAARRPHIVADTTVPGATQWAAGPSELIHAVPDERSVIWFPIDVVVDTTSAGFSATPAYLAELSGPRVDLSQLQFFRPLSPHIVDETPQRFTFRFWLLLLQAVFEIEAAAAASPGSATAFTLDGFRHFARQQRLHVAWLGCEGEPDAAPKATRRTPSLCGCAATSMPLSI
jgi:hypothetical protein